MLSESRAFQDELEAANWRLTQDNARLLAENRRLREEVTYLRGVNSSQAGELAHLRRHVTLRPQKYYGQLQGVRQTQDTFRYVSATGLAGVHAVRS